MCVCVCSCNYICIRVVYMQTYRCLNIHVYIYVNVYTYMYICICIYVNVYICAGTYIHTCIHTHLHMPSPMQTTHRHMHMPFFGASCFCWACHQHCCTTSINLVLRAAIYLPLFLGIRCCLSLAYNPSSGIELSLDLNDQVVLERGGCVWPLREIHTRL